MTYAIPLCAWCGEWEVATFAGGDEHFCSSACLDEAMNAADTITVDLRDMEALTVMRDEKEAAVAITRWQELRRNDSVGDDFDDQGVLD